LRFFPRQLC